MKFTYDQIRQDAILMEVDFQWALGARKRYLNAEIGFHKKQISGLVSSCAGKNALERELIFTWTKKHEDEIKDLEKEIMSFLRPSGKGVITDAMIQKAKEYPVRDLLPGDSQRNVTNCIAHDDNNPSMSIKDNRVRCFSCGFAGDAIDVYMYVNGVDFAIAVKRLAR